MATTYYQIRLYGVNNDYSYNVDSETPFSTFSGDATLEAVDLYVTKIQPYFEQEGEEYESPGGQLAPDYYNRSTYSVSVKMMKHPDDINDFNNLVKVLLRKYHWFRPLDYDITISSENTTPIAVIVNYNISEADGFREITLDMKKRALTTTFPDIL